MSGNQFVWSGLEELKAQLRALPTELAAEAGDIILATAEAAKQAISDGYPTRTGDLKHHLYVRKSAAGLYGAGAIVVNTSKLASIFENGTQARHTSLGANRGSMPPGHVFIPVMMRKRREMYGQLADLLTRHGLQVSGTP